MSESIETCTIPAKVPHVEPSRGYVVSPNWSRYLRQLDEWCSPFAGATDWYRDLLNYTLVWDHVVDGDPIHRAHADVSFEAVLIKWPFNNFWQNYQRELVPLLSDWIAKWRADGESMGAWIGYVTIPMFMLTKIRGAEFAESKRDYIERSIIIDRKLDIEEEKQEA